MYICSFHPVKPIKSVSFVKDTTENGPSLAVMAVQIDC